MLTKRAVPGLFATAMAAAAIIAGATAGTPNTYHDMSPQLSTHTVAAAGSVNVVRASTVSPNTYHDM